MRFERIKKLERILFAAGAILLIAAGAVFLKATGPVSSDAFDEARAVIRTLWTCFGLSVFSFFQGFVLHILRKDVEEEVRDLERKLNK
ncbi:MAG: hypothetical protein IKM31_07730 [Oscillospiraceae bacterium]|nr:hypothetical protein [Oscillospiraceae bacterium]